MNPFLQPIRFTKFLYDTFYGRDISLHAAGLAFKTLLSLIPLGVVAATVFAVVAAGDVGTDEDGTPGPDSLQQVRELIDRFLIPDQAEKATAWIEAQVRTLRSNKTGVTAVGLLALLGTAFFLFQTVEAVMNLIYRAPSRSITSQFLLFWSFVTLGPILFGASIYATQRLPDSVREQIGVLTDLGPFVVTLIAMFLLNKLAPTPTVRTLPALGGAIVAAAAWEAMKHGFNAYLARFATYDSVYGNLATGVILLLWLYMSWYVALLGASIAYSLQESGSPPAGDAPLPEERTVTD